MSINKEKKYNFPVIPHTHWDREWYFTTSRSKIYSLNHFKEIFDVLEDNDNFKHFLLDAQLSIIDDYLEFHPYDEERIKRLVSKGKLIIGPWYTQTDQMVISGESIIRNLYYGIERAKYFGNYMKTGYMPDSFGQSAQMPQILNGFDINYNTFKRGLSDNHYLKNEFYWEAPDGSKVFNMYLDRYGNFVYFTSEEGSLNNLIKKLKEETDRRSLVGTLTLYNGEDQRPIRKNLPEIIEKLNKLHSDSNFYMSTIDEVMKKTENNGFHYDTVKGEMTAGQFSRVHKSIYSTRADLKIKNNKNENYIVNIAEPLNTIAYKLGFQYENKVFEKVWKLMAENAAHDSIGMCNSDKTNKSIEYRCDTVKSLTENLVELKMREIGSSIPEKDIFQFQVYNLLPYERSGILKAEIFTPSIEFEICDTDDNVYEIEILKSEKLAERIKNKMKSEVGFNTNDNPRWIKENVEIYKTEVLIYIKNLHPMGYKTLFIREKSLKISKSSIEKNNVVENENLKVTVCENGSIIIKNKKENFERKGFLILENSGDEGDTYDYSEPYKDRIITSENSTIEVLEIKNNSLLHEIKYSLKMNIPYNLKMRKKNEDEVINEFFVTLSLEKESFLLKVDIEVENKAIEHRTRVLFKTEIESKESIADQQFGIIKRPVYLPEVENWRENGWNEKPRTIEAMQSFVSLSDKCGTVSIMTDCVREYQVIGEKYDMIALTLFRSVPEMGKADLQDRPGRASGMADYLTPDARLLKKLNFNFAIFISKNEFSASDMTNLSKEYLTPFQYYQAAEFKNVDIFFLMNKPEIQSTPFSYSLFSFENKDCVLSTVKKAEKEDGLIIRIYNPDDVKITDFSMIYNEKFNKVDLVKFNEETIMDKIDFSYEEIDGKNRIRVKNVKTCQALTVRVK
ncbi:glycoside hydrolase family 38 N-terminal domain-containing protein [Pseudoleptotrichia goodfellowii]|uniref:Glycosyl hydrolase family 38 N-terminal domain protein n=1 Tax=Pseudoleptotrichia goodfellowii TaxID=157692 RepID=A0A510JAL7_9FUSO|nr:glycoside hydrolase family 38 C-terminal domain-containing protein [Pseudoleptotrichia goodfellowii]BBM35225.1 glycosyl hydrolase family 38 N-terminal domain protein [Pseudoleptotrichia goodfellowii]